MSGGEAVARGKDVALKMDEPWGTPVVPPETISAGSSRPVSTAGAFESAVRVLLPLPCRHHIDKTLDVGSGSSPAEVADAAVDDRGLIRRGR